MKKLLFTFLAVLFFSFGNAQTNYETVLTSLVKSSENNFKDIFGEQLSKQGYVSTYSSKIKFGVGKEFIDKMPENTLGNIFTLVSTAQNSQDLEVVVIDYVNAHFTGDQYSISLDRDEKTGYYSIIIIRKGTASMFMQAEKKFNKDLKADEYQLKLYGKN